MERVPSQAIDADIEATVGQAIPPYKKPFLRKCYRLALRLSQAGDTRGMEAALLLMRLALATERRVEKSDPG